MMIDDGTTVTRRFHFIHRWMSWRKITIEKTNADPPYSVSGQDRKCMVCGKRELREL
jgi:hypothetical protein